MAARRSPSATGLAQAACSWLTGGICAREGHMRCKSWSYISVHWSAVQGGEGLGFSQTQGEAASKLVGELLVPAVFGAAFAYRVFGS